MNQIPPENLVPAVQYEIRGIPGTHTAGETWKGAFLRTETNGITFQDSVHPQSLYFQSPYYTYHGPDVGKYERIKHALKARYDYQKNLKSTWN